MGWGHCGEDDRGRPIGYAIPATCDEAGCEKAIDRGLSYVCGGMHGGGEWGCGGYFCEGHLWMGPDSWLCRSCRDEAEKASGTVCQGEAE